MKFQVMDK